MEQANFGDVMFVVRSQLEVIANNPDNTYQKTREKVDTVLLPLGAYGQYQGAIKVAQELREKWTREDKVPGAYHASAKSLVEKIAKSEKLQDQVLLLALYVCDAVNHDLAKERIVAGGKSEQALVMAYKSQAIRDS
jgi:hypothetical protein